MHYRKPDHRITELQLKFREVWVLAFKQFTIHDIDRCLLQKDELIKVATELKGFETSQEDINYFTSLYYLINAVFLLLQGHKNQLSGLPGSEELSGARINADQLLHLASSLDQLKPSVQQFIQVAQDIKSVDSIEKVPELMTLLNKIAFPIILTIETSRYGRYKGMQSEFETGEKLISEAEKPVISVLFYIDTELWANPQIVKPNQLYSLSGVIKLNHWPQDYDQLILTHISTTDDSWFVLSLPSIKITTEKQIPIKGSITLKYPQSSLDAPLSIRMLARFTGENKKTLFPVIIGYDQLILRVIDQHSFDFPTGYDKLNEKALEISLQIQQELRIPKPELQNFLTLLSSILNYQGFCYQYAEYKGKSDVTEEIFRDNLIKYLSANPHFSSTIIKEGTIAGGRVEINFNGIIAELKVEKTISDRQKIIQKYQKQPAAYASSTSAQLSILCVLDLIGKIHPPSIAAKNVFLVSPVLHGFENTPSSSRIAIIIIDGNTKNPSSYF